MKNIVFLTALIICSGHQLLGQVHLIELGNHWKYFDLGHEPADQDGTKWYTKQYDDNLWEEGPGQLGYGEQDEETVLSNAATLYFRYTFAIIDPAVLDSLFLELIYDDGAIIYINNEEVWRINMPGGPVDYATSSSAQSAINAGANTFINNILQSGTNVIAVEIHQYDASSQNASFDFRLIGTQEGQISLERGPYIQKASPESMTIKWRTAPATNAFVLYGTHPDSLIELAFDLDLRTDHELTLDGLAADTRYYYALADENGFILEPDPSLFFETSPPSGSQAAVRAWILGDCGTGNSNQRAVRDAFYDFMDGDHTDMILFLGDNAYNDGTDAEYQQSLFENMYESILRNTVSWSCLGNHDGHSADSGTQTGPYYDIFSFPTNGESGGIASGTEAYYSFDYGNVHFISLDSYESDRTVGGTMYDWCLADIQNTTADWIVAFWHHPPYTKGSHDSDTETPLKEMRQNFLPMLEENGVDLILSGHSHSYERSYFLKGHYDVSTTFDTSIHIVGPNGSGNGQINGDGSYQKNISSAADAQGTVYVTAGSSGKVSSGSLDHPVMYYSVASLGSCFLEIEGDQLSLKFIRENGTIEDYFSIQKSPECILNDPCDDGDLCTDNDVLNEDCICAGTFADEDDDGVCDVNDLCPEFNDELIGSPCNDLDPCTIEDRYTENCTCAGQFIDGDQDGICDSFDLCPNLNDSLIGMPCDDQLPCTIDDRYTSECACVGTFVDGDEDGICDEEDLCPDLDDSLIGTPCDDLNDCTVGDIFTEHCSCEGIESDTDGDGICDELDICPIIPDDLIGTSCDDGVACTHDDIFTEDCTCAGTISDTDDDGICDAEDRCPDFNDALIGTVCDDDNPCTDEDRIQEDCTCRGALRDRDEDGICDEGDDCPDLPNSLIGTPCDDGDPCTTDDFYRSNCECIGAFRDTDEDGVCDEMDRCEGQDDALIGQPCDDDNECTVEDTFTAECQCIGIFRDNDGDGFCYAVDPDDYDICIPDISVGGCQPCSTLFFDTFENGLGNWIDGGRDCARVAGNANTGVHSMRIRDNSGPSSSLFTKPLDLDIYASVTISFTFIPIGMDATEDFFLEISVDSGATFEKTRTWIKGRDFENNKRYFDQIEISEVAFTDETVFRIRCDASGNNDQIYIDDIEIAACRVTCIAGTPCNDQNDCTIEDVYDHNCRCIGIEQDTDQDGICDQFDPCPLLNDDLIGAACNDDDPCTVDDVYTDDCKCTGRFVDSDDDGICDVEDLCPDLHKELIGTPCDDGEECTRNDKYTEDCQCIGTFSDADEDGICDELDECPGQYDGLIGTPCDDGDLCTRDDVYSDDCVCIGIYTDQDGDGLCIGEDPDDTDPCTPDKNATRCGTCPDFDESNFEENLGIWNDGGSDCARVRLHGHTGFYSMRLRDNSGSRSSMFTNIIDFSDYQEVHIAFTYVPIGMEVNEDFILEISVNGGDSFLPVKNWQSGKDFANGSRYFETVVIHREFLSEQSVIRLRCDASNNSDQVYIDDVVITACPLSIISNSIPPERTQTNGDQITAFSLTVFPNPASGRILISANSGVYEMAQVTIVDLSGRMIRNIVLSNPTLSRYEIDVTEWKEGVYIAVLSVQGAFIAHQKIVIAR